MIPKQFKKELNEAINEAISGAVANLPAVWEAIEKQLQQDLEQSSCSLSFDGNVEAYVRLTDSGEVGHTLIPKIDIDIYGRHSAQQREHVEDQIKGIDKFIAELEEAKRELEDDLKNSQPR